MSKKDMVVGALVAMVGFGLSVAGAKSQEIDVQRLQRIPEVRAAVNACMSDRDRLCSEVAPGGGRIVRCLAGQADRLSPPCNAAMVKASAALKSAGIAIQPNASK
ncbi:MAG: hypothetical protein EKK41_02650 [Hyphomicrobiales bacterium]|nr:MAG: hypothetical protein EKK41_02650 [Hyphomicrobiales bacterium]